MGPLNAPGVPEAMPNRHPGWKPPSPNEWLHRGLLFARDVSMGNPRVARHLPRLQLNPENFRPKIAITQRMKKFLLLLCATVNGACVARANWGVAPPPYIPLNTAMTVSVAPGRWKVPTSNIKLEVVWFRDPNGKWHPEKIASFGSSDSGKNDVSLTGLNFFTVPGVWTGEVVVQTYPIGIYPPDNLFQVIAEPALVLVGAPTPTPTPTPTHTPTPTPTPTPSPSEVIPTPTPTPTPKDKLFK